MAKMSKMARRENAVAYGFVSVKIVGFLIFTATPVVFSILFSFTKLNPLKNTEPFLTIMGDIWVGFEQYVKLFNSPIYAQKFLNAVVNTLVLLCSVPTGMAVGCLLAVLLSSIRLKGASVIRLLIYLPVVASAVAMGLIWRYIFEPEYGLINLVLGKQINWFYDKSLIKLAIIIKNTWGSMGRNMILFLAAILAIGKDYYEFSDMEGASGWQKFKYITFPMITPTTFYLLITGIISHLQAYADAEIFAAGAEGARTVVYFIWLYGIKNNNYGLAAAASVLLSVTIMTVTVIQFKMSNKWVFED